VRSPRSSARSPRSRWWRLARLAGGATVLTVLLPGVVLTSFAGGLVTFILVSSDRLAAPSARRSSAVAGRHLVIIWASWRWPRIVSRSRDRCLLLAPRIDALRLREETAAALVDLGMCGDDRV